MNDSYTVEAMVGQWLGSNAWQYGIETVRPDGASNAFMYGLPLSQVVGRQLGNGTRVRVTVEIIEEHPLQEGTGWRQAQKEHAERERRVAAWRGQKT